MHVVLFTEKRKLHAILYSAIVSTHYIYNIPFSLSIYFSPLSLSLTSDLLNFQVEDNILTMAPVLSPPLPSHPSLNRGGNAPHGSLICQSCSCLIRQRSPQIVRTDPTYNCTLCQFSKACTYVDLKPM